MYCKYQSVYRALRGNATTHFSTNPSPPPLTVHCTGHQAREGYGRRGVETADFTVHRPHHLPDDDGAADLDTPATTSAAAKINKTRNKFQIDFFFFRFLHFTLQTRRPSIWHGAGQEPNAPIADPHSFRFTRGRRHRRHSSRTHKLQSFFVGFDYTR